ncbi:MAG: hypothetical protein COB02_07785 [Candidatus Cloacimonadota bacterium]|nr:MAG: hypothetical protein COB02_07785 [Candidatus Cloacimonadota bacterium]
MLKISLRKSFVLFALSGLLLQGSVMADNDVEDSNLPEQNVSKTTDDLLNDKEEKQSGWLTDPDGRYVYVDGQPVPNNGRFEIVKIGDGSYTIGDNEKKTNIMSNRVSSKPSEPPYVLRPYGMVYDSDKPLDFGNGLTEPSVLTENSNSNSNSGDVNYFDYGDEDPGTTSPSDRQKCNDAGATGGTVPLGTADSIGCIQQFNEGEKNSGNDSEAPAGCSDDFIGPPTMECVKYREKMKEKALTDEQSPLELLPEDPKEQETNSNGEIDENPPVNSNGETDENPPANLDDAVRGMMGENPDLFGSTETPKADVQNNSEEYEDAIMRAAKEKENAERVEAKLALEKELSTEESDQNRRSILDKMNGGDGNLEGSNVPEPKKGSFYPGEDTIQITPREENKVDDFYGKPEDEEKKVDQKSESELEIEDSEYEDRIMREAKEKKEKESPEKKPEEVEIVVEEAAVEPVAVEEVKDDEVGIPSDKAAKQVIKFEENTGVSALNDNTGEYQPEEFTLIENALTDAEMAIIEENLVSVDTSAIIRIQRDGDRMGSTFVDVDTKFIKGKNMSTQDLKKFFENVYQDETLLMNKINACKQLPSVKTGKQSVCSCIKEDIVSFENDLVSPFVCTDN